MGNREPEQHCRGAAFLSENLQVLLAIMEMVLWIVDYPWSLISLL